MALLVKICGISDHDGLFAALEGGADMVGFVFFGPSPRNIDPHAAGHLADHVPSGVDRVGVMVDPTDEFIDAVLKEAPLDLIQLHGRESPARVQAIKDRIARPVIKALPIAGPKDFIAAASYEEAADWLMFDAKPPKGAALPGGLGQAFDWTLLQGRKFNRPWILSGGLMAGNLGQAVAASGAIAVDVSSGVESAPGIKDPDKIKAFLDAARLL